ncbi:MAG: alpha/beta fold hydrolase [Spirochaetota bacterium]
MNTKIYTIASSGTFGTTGQRRRQDGTCKNGNHDHGSHSLAVLIHGIGGHKEDWLETDGYTKGGNLTKALEEDGVSWIACDLYGHGENAAREDGFDSNNISDELWPRFISQSADCILTHLSALCQEHRFSSLSVITYSAGCQVGMTLLRRILPIPVESVLMAALTPERNYDDEYSLHNNLDALSGKNVCFFSGSHDSIVPVGDVRWVYDRLQNEKKALYIYETDHSLPVEWTKDAMHALHASSAAYQQRHHT